MDFRRLGRESVARRSEESVREKSVDWGEKIRVEGSIGGGICRSWMVDVGRK